MKMKERLAFVYMKEIPSWFRKYIRELVINLRLLVKSMHKKVLKGAKWMPRRILPMKDVEDCDKLREAVNKL